MAGEIATAFVRIRPDSTGFQSILGRQTQGIGRNVGGAIGKAMAIGIGGGVAIAAGGLASAVKLAIGFDKAMRNVNSIAKLNEKDFGDLNKRVLELAKTAGVGPETLAKGLYDVVSSGFKAHDAMIILAAGAKAAKAGLTDTATATSAVTAVLNSYHLKATDATRVSDALFQTVNIGVLSFSELASQIGDVLPFASSLGVNVENVGAAIATMTKEGISAAETVTRIKSIMSEFLKPSKDLAAAIKSQGFASGEAMIKSLGFQGSLDRLAKATGGSKTELAKLFPNIRALGGALALTGANSRTAHGDLEALRMSMGATAGAAAEQAKSISQQWDKAIGRLQASAITLGAQILPTISHGIELFATLADKIGVLAKQPTLKLKAQFAMDEILSAAGQIKDTVSKALDDALNGQSFTPGAKFNNAIGQVDTGGLIGQFDKIDWGSVGKKIMAGIAAGMSTAEGGFNTVVDGIANALEANQGRIGEVGALLALNLVKTLGDPAFWAAHWQLILAVIIAVFPAGKFVKLGQLIALPFRAAGGLIARALEEGLLRVGIVVERFGGRLGGWLVDAVVFAAKAVAFVAKGVGEGIANAVGTGIGKVSSVVKRILRTGVVLGIVGTVGSVVSAAVSLGGKIISGIGQGLATIFSDVVNFMTGVPHAIANAATAAYNAALSLGSDIVNGIINGVTSLPGQLAAKVTQLAKDAIHAASLGIIAKSPSLLAARMIGQPLVEGMVMGVERNKKKLSVTLTAAARQAVADAKQNLLSLTGSLGDSIGQIMDARLKRTLGPLQAQLDALNGNPIADIGSQRDAAARDAAAQRAALTSSLGGAMASGESIDDYIARQADIRKQIADLDKATALQMADFDAQLAKATLQAKIDAITAESQARRDAIAQQVADVTAQFNAGILNGKQLTAKLSEILKASGASVAQAGELLGFAFAQQFKAQVGDVTAQVLALAQVIGLKGGASGGAGFGSSVTNPLDEVKNQLKDQRGSLTKDRGQLKDALAREAEAKKALHDATTQKQRDAAEKKLNKAEADIRREQREIARDRALIKALEKILAAAQGIAVGQINVTSAGTGEDLLAGLGDIANAGTR